MPQVVRVVHFTFATGATATNTQFVGNAARVNVYVSNITGWNSAAGNATFALRGAPLSSITHVSIPGGSITTETGQGIYHVSTAVGIPFMSVGFGSITSGAGTISVMLGDDN